jgi:2-polyprenyl-3-methyl-5-hydroxy-6-metoxy-1,4-benzoquinol methylase
MHRSTQHAMKFTGERPGRGRDFDYDEARHLAAYVFVAKMATGKRVLDAGCGDGFGTQTLADRALDVLGVDASPQAIAACRRSWDMPRLRFEQEDLAHPQTPGETFDLVLSFQVLEHLAAPMPFLQTLKARLRPAGILVLTTPNRLTSFSENPFHVHEYTAPELAALLSGVFGSVSIMGLHGSEKVRAFDHRRQRSVQRILRLDPLRIRKVLPRRAVEFAFARLAVLVRRQAQQPAGDRIVPEDFTVTGGTEEALDLVAICQA